MHNMTCPHVSRCFFMCIKYPAFKTLHPPTASLTSVLQPLNSQGNTAILRLPALTQTSTRLSQLCCKTTLSLTGAEIFGFSVCSCKSPSSVRLEEGFLCKLLEIKDYIISYTTCLCLCLWTFSVNVWVVTRSKNSSLLIFAQRRLFSSLTLITSSTFAFLSFDYTSLMTVKSSHVNFIHIAPYHNKCYLMTLYK